MGRFFQHRASSALAFVSATAIVLAIVALTPRQSVYSTSVSVHAAAASEAELQRYREFVIDEFVALVNGTWTLVDRYNPDGSRHAEPLTGWTRIDISPARTTHLSTRAMGSIQAEETGVWDRRMGPQGPADAFGKPFYIESNGTWEIMLDPTQPLVVGSGEAHIIVAQMSTVRGTYKPYADGLMTQLDSRYLLTVRRQSRDAHGNLVVRPASLKLKEPITPHDPVTFRGRRLPNAWLNPIDFKGEPIPAKELESSDCAVDEFSVTGSEMHIKWISGARDYWVNRPASETTNASAGTPRTTPR